MPDSQNDTLLLDAPPVDERDGLSQLADRLMPKILRQLDAGIKYRQPKIEKILKGEELYFNKIVKTLKGRFTIPLPIVSGYVETLLSKVDDEININYDHTEEADKNKARKVTASWKYDSAPTRGMWAIKDIVAKKLAIFSGRAIYKKFAESPYKDHLEIVDAFDFIAEPGGGWYLENHLFCGQQNIFRSKADLLAGEQYDQAQVSKLISSTTENVLKDNQDQYYNSQKRHEALGMDNVANNYVGEDVYNLTEWNLEHDGKRYYVLFDARAKTWIRIAPLEEITGEPPEGEKVRYLFKSWATHLDYWNFWSKAPVDDVVPVAIGLKTITNFGFDDLQKRLWGQRIFDPDFFPDPAQLEWDRPDKLVMATVPNGKVVSQGIYEFKMEDNSGVVINMLEYFRNFLATETGVTNASKGNADDKLLGIAEINAGQVADRLGLLNKLYSQCYAELGEGYLAGLKMCMTTKRMIRYIGEDGAESGELTQDELDFSSEPDIRITGGKSEQQKDAQKNQLKQGAISQIVLFAPDVLNKKVTSEYLLQEAGWTPDEIFALMDVDSDGDEQQSIRASQAIQDILNKKTPKLFKGATTRFISIIIEYNEEHELPDAIGATLMSYALAHKTYVIQNMARKAMLANMRQPIAPATPTNNANPAPNGPIQTPPQNSNVPVPSKNVASTISELGTNVPSLNG